MDHEIPLRGSSFPPIADYALLSDCEVCALVAPGGNVEWLSLPQMDGPSVFSAILDRHAGRFRVGPWRHDAERSERYVRAPRDHEAGHVLVRVLRCLDGFVDVEIECEPAFDY